MALTGSSIASTYLKLLRANENTMGADATASYIQDSADTDSALSISTTRVGIGTDSPSKQFQVEGSSGGVISINTSASASSGYCGRLVFGNDGTDDVLADINAIQDGATDAAKLQFRTEATGEGISTRMTIKSTGLIGIGTASPATHLHIAEDDGSNHPILTLERTDSTVANDAVIGEIDFVGDEGGAADVVGSIKCIADTAWSSNDQPTYLAFSTCKENEYAATEKMRITMEGNVGIGYITPQSNLQIAKTSFTAGYTAANAYINIGAGDWGANATKLITFGYAPSSKTYAPAYIGFVEDAVPAGDIKGDLIFGTRPTTTDVQPTERMRIDSAGTQNQQGNYIVNEQGRQDHVANTMPAPYYRFDGSNDYIEIGSESDILTQSTGSFEIWFNPDDVDNNVLLGLSDKTSGADDEIEIFFDNTDNSIYYKEVAGGSTSYKVKTPASSVSPEATTHLVITTDASTMKFYINGILQTLTVSDGSNTGQWFATPDEPVDNVTIGGVWRSSSILRCFTGRIYSSRFFNLELSATEVKELYSGASVPFKYKGANQTEMMPDQVDRDFSGASSWANVTYGGNYHDSGDLSLQSNGVDQYCTLPVADAPTTIGKRYRVSVDFTLVAADKTFTIQSFDGTQNFGTISATGTGQTFEFTAETTGGYRVKADHSGSAGDFNNFSLTQIGAVAEYDGSGVGASRWDDKSGNELHGTVSGATVENAPADADSGLTYEEGTWTPVFAGGSSAGSYSMTNTVARYTKIGRVVHVSCSAFNVTEASAGSGAINITGLPFTVESTASSRANVGTLELDLFSFTGSLSCTASAGNTYVEFRASATGANDVVLQVGARDGNDSDFVFNVTYTV